MQSKIQEYERALQKNEGPLIAQVHPYKLITDKSDANTTNDATKIVDKGK